MQSAGRACANPSDTLSGGCERTLSGGRRIANRQTARTSTDEFHATAQPHPCRVALRYVRGGTMNPTRIQSSDRASAVDIHAFRALAALELYEAQLKLLLQDRAEPGRRHAVREHMTALRRCCAGCAGLTVPWLDLMISHFEQLERLDEGARPRTDAGEEALAQATRRHQACVRELALACRSKMQARTVVGTRESVSRTRRAARAQADAGAPGNAS
jgi:hypothetical protein